MVEEIFKLFIEGNVNEGKKFIKKHYDEIGELVYAITVNNEYIEGPDGANGYAGFIKYLSDCGHNLDFCDDNGNTALHGAVNGQDSLMVMAFIDRKELFTQKNNQGITPIMLGFTKENEELKNVLALQIGDAVNDAIMVNGEEMSYLTLAIYTCAPEVIPIILMNENFDYEFHKKYLDDVEWDDSEEDETRQNLINNYVEQYVNVIEDEIELDDDLLLDDNLEEEDDLELMRAGLTPLMIAIAQADFDEVKKLIDKGANVNHRNNAGFTPLMIATFMNNYEIVEYLIKQGAYLECPISDGLTPLVKAVLANNYELVKLMLDNNVYIDKVSAKRLENVRKYNKEIEDKVWNLIDCYNNPSEVKREFPFEEMYGLGFEETAEGDGYYGVIDVFAEEYGTNMINDFSNINGFVPMYSIFHNESEKKSKNGVMFVAPIHLNKFSKSALLYEDGTVSGYLIGKDNEEIDDFKEWKNIKQIVSTNYTVIGLTNDGKIVYNDLDMNPWLKETDSWSNIKKIAAGNNSLFALTNDGEFKYAISDLDTMIFGDKLEMYVDRNDFVDFDAHGFNVYFVCNDGTVCGVGYTNGLADAAIESIVDAIAISVNDHVCVLRKDHTVLAFKNNKYCQCNVAKWHDIERIQATHFSTIGYASNGEILCTDYMSVNENSRVPFANAAKWGDGFGNAIMMSQYEPDAINLEMKGE